MVGMAQGLARGLVAVLAALSSDRVLGNSTINAVPWAIFTLVVPLVLTLQSPRT